MIYGNNENFFFFLLLISITLSIVYRTERISDICFKSAMDYNDVGHHLGTHLTLRLNSAGAHADGAAGSNLQYATAPPISGIIPL